MEDIISHLSNNLLEDGNHSAYYKLRGEDKHNQEKRRLNLLSSQKEKRENSHDNSRGILDLIQEDEAKLQYCSQHSQGSYKPRVHVPGFHRSTPLYADTLMLSEWMIERPEDLENDWYALVCPKGKRVLVVASGGKTKAYLKYGKFYQEWKSCLPGGCYNDSNKYCVLDCVISDNQTVYVLDVLAWGNLTMTECEHEFRYFWLKSKFSEADYTTVTSENKLSIRLIERCNSTKDELSNVLMNWPAYPSNDPPADGLLFYHKRAFYIKSYTPLVVWLFPYMVHEVISNDIMVHNNYLEEKPSDYTNQMEFIQKFEQKMANKKTKMKKYVSNSFSSGSSPDSSLNSSTNSLESFGSGQVHYVFKANSDHVAANKNKKKKNKNKQVAMDVGLTDISTDSAVGFMDDSLSNKSHQTENME